MGVNPPTWTQFKLGTAVEDCKEAHGSAALGFALSAKRRAIADVLRAQSCLRLCGSRPVFGDGIFDFGPIL
jgi:hypothetical protein